MNPPRLVLEVVETSTLQAAMPHALSELTNVLYLLALVILTLVLIG